MVIQVAQEGLAPHEVAVGEAPLLFGRAPTNDVVLTDDQISWHHAAVWVEGGRVWIRDIGSRNGMFRNGERLRGAECFGPADEVTLGPTTRIRAVGSASAEGSALLVEDVGSGVRFPIRSDRFHIGAAQGSDLRVEGPERAATLLVEPDGAVLLATEDSAVEVRPGQPFEIAGRRLRVVEVRGTHAPTVEPEPDRYPYRLSTTLDGPTGAEARFENPRTGEQYLVEAENRAILVFLLARQVASDLAAGRAEPEVGWVGDDDVSIGVWGKGGPSDANSLHVLVYRLRKELQRAGFDPWFIEKRRRALRLRLTDVTVR